jgi:hypothetical protein
MRVPEKTTKTEENKREMAGIYHSGDGKKIAQPLSDRGDPLVTVDCDRGHKCPFLFSALTRYIIVMLFASILTLTASIACPNSSKLSLSSPEPCCFHLLSKLSLRL